MPHPRPTAHLLIPLLSVLAFISLSTATMVWEQLVPTTGGDAPPATCEGASIVLHSGQLYVFGGMCKGVMSSTDVYVFAINSRTWTKLQTGGDVPDARAYHVAAVLEHEGSKASMVVMGGEYVVADGSTRLINDNYMHFLDLENAPYMWKREALENPQYSVRTRAASARLSEREQVFIHGGMESASASAASVTNLFLSYVDESEWSLQTVDPQVDTPPLCGHAMAHLSGTHGDVDDTSVFVSGGAISGNTSAVPRTGTYQYTESAVTETWVTRDSMALGRTGHGLVTATASVGGGSGSGVGEKVLVAVGGMIGIGAGGMPMLTRSIEAYHIATDQWFAPNVSFAGNPPDPMAGAAFVGAGDFSTEVYVFGGEVGPGLCTNQVWRLHTNNRSMVCPGSDTGAGSCLGHGWCDSSTGICHCNPTWIGPACGVPLEYPCPHDCFYPTNGACDRSTGKCVCHDGFDGADCSIPPGSFIIPLAIALVLILVLGGAFAGAWIVKHRKAAVSIYSRLPGEDVGGKRAAAAVDHAELGILQDVHSASVTAARRAPRLAGDM